MLLRAPWDQNYTVAPDTMWRVVRRSGKDVLSVGPLGLTPASADGYQVRATVGCGGRFPAGCTLALMMLKAQFFSCFLQVRVGRMVEAGAMVQGLCVREVAVRMC